MTRRDDERDLENPEHWDYERGEKRPGVKGARAVVSVAFGREDFDRVVACAEHLGKKTSEFIREAAVDKARRVWEPATVATYSGSARSFLFTERPVPTTRGVALPEITVYA